MSDSGKAFKVGYFDKDQKFKITNLELKDIPDDEVLVQVEYSTINYKDALAITGKAPIVKTFPLVGGIDYAGAVKESKVAGFQVGDKVALTGAGAGETLYGGYSAFAKVKSTNLVKLPPELTCQDAMAIGTAGFTAMLCVVRMLELGSDPKQGPIVVTGASGGVGSFAVALLSSLGFDVHASTSRPEQQAEYLKSLGACQVIDSKTLSGKGKPLDKAIYAGVVDSVGGEILANLLSKLKVGGIVTACGLAASSSLSTTVLPFILRGVTLAGVDSVQVPPFKRQQAWKKLATDLDRKKLALICPRESQNIIGLDQLPETAAKIIACGHRGRVLVDVLK